MNLRAILFGIVVGIAVSSAVTAGAAWLVQSEGEVGVQLASLEPLKVGTASVDGEAYPGKTVGLKADVENPNPVRLAILSSSLESGLHSNIPACQAGLDDVKYLDNNDVGVEPGKTEGVVLGRLQLPPRLPNACQGEKLTAQVVVKAAYGS